MYEYLVLHAKTPAFMNNFMGCYLSFTVLLIYKFHSVSQKITKLYRFGYHMKKIAIGYSLSNLVKALFTTNLFTNLRFLLLKANCRKIQNFSKFNTFTLILIDTHRQYKKMRIF